MAKRRLYIAAFYRQSGIKRYSGAEEANSRQPPGGQGPPGDVMMVVVPVPWLAAFSPYQLVA